MKLYFKVADAYYCVNFTDKDYDGRQLILSSRPFYVKDYIGSVMFTLTVGAELVSAEAEGEEIGQFDCAGMVHGVYRTPTGYKFLIRNGVGNTTCAFSATEDFTICEASLFGQLEDKAFGVNNALMMIFAFAGAYHNILLIHSSVTMLEGKGYLFLGVSGTGKSTHSQLWQKHYPTSELLNDDNPALRLIDGEVRVYGSPWSGKTPCYRNLSVPIGAFVQLKQAPENIIRKERPLNAFINIFTSCSTMIWDKASYQAISDTVTEIVEHTPVYFLECRADEAAAHLSHDTIVR